MNENIESIKGLTSNVNDIGITQTDNALSDLNLMGNYLGGDLAGDYSGGMGGMGATTGNIDGPIFQLPCFSSKYSKISSMYTGGNRNSFYFLEDGGPLAFLGLDHRRLGKPTTGERRTVLNLKRVSLQ